MSLSRSSGCALLSPAAPSRRVVQQLIAVLVAAAMWLCGTAQAGHPISGADRGPAIGGYDPVAYFTTDKPTPGDPAITHEWQAATWQFASEANRALFVADPARYAPQYGAAKDPVNLAGMIAQNFLRLASSPIFWMAMESAGGASS